MAGTFAAGLAFGHAYGEPPDAWVDEIGEDGGTLFLRDQSGVGRAIHYSNSNWRTAFSAPVFGAIRPTDRTDLMRGITNFLLDGTAVGERPGAAGPAGFTVAPNPARPGQPVRVRVPAGTGRVTVHDASGRTVATLEPDHAGVASWSCLRPDGRAVPAGAYFVRAATGGQTLGRTLVLAR
ncbi:MAG: hypothetical protein R6X12_09195 [bacterium]